MEAQMYLPSYMREVAQSGNLNHNQHANYVELLADFAEKRDKEFYALRSECNKLKTIASQDEALLREALYALEYASDMTKPDDLQGCGCPICTSIAALRERLGEGES